MTITELIRELEYLLSVEGDIQVTIRPAREERPITKVEVACGRMLSINTGNISVKGKLIAGS